ncbi:MAG: orotidine-5'-phosphate decarboxylase [Kiritimatiellae bacterium]|nr:orotidine-5'-phosphate decarboxylase [Kiritimatiellia bacterium]MCO5068307.1 orotidine-5'-phosphate decarboxylase [Kiritimatiellia bacterium]
MNTRKQTELIVALDVNSQAEMIRALELLPADIQWVKVGLELFCAEGPSILLPLRDRNLSVFLDLKLHDIPKTVEKAVKSASKHGVQLLTIHASGGREMIRAACVAAREFGQNGPKILAVTALTSLQDSDLKDIGVQRGMSEQVRALAHLAVDAGADGLVCSPLETALLRRELGEKPLLVTPGIRSQKDEMGDQKRTLSAGDAVRAGATHLVVGRPILAAADPARAAAQLLSEIRAASAS